MRVVVENFEFRGSPSFIVECLRERSYLVTIDNSDYVGPVMRRLGYLGIGKLTCQRFLDVLESNGVIKVEREIPNRVLKHWRPKAMLCWSEE